MKITKRIIVGARVAGFRDEEVTVCDFCGKKWGNLCSSCNREMCKACTMYDPEELGDYPAKFCKICHNLRFVRYAGDYHEEQVRHDIELTDLDIKVRKESLKTPIS